MQPPAERIATCCTEAIFGYAEAATALWWNAAEEMIETCNRMASSAMPGASVEPTSWFNPKPGAQPYYAGCDTLKSVPATMTPWLDMFSPPAVQPFAAPFAWLDMYPLRGGPAAWPMAFFMLQAGVPKSVAWPTATANAAMMEAAEVATGQMQNAMASYRSDGGHAAAANANDWLPDTPTIAAYRHYEYSA